MKFLAIDTSGSYLTVICYNDGKTYSEFLNDANMQHSVILMPSIDKVLKSANLTPYDMDFFACSVGAGSFTGIRIGVSTIKAFCYATNKPSLKITSFDIMAYNTKETENVLAIIDAKHEHYYVCGYDKDKNIILKPSFISFEELTELQKYYKLVSLNNVDKFDAEILSPKDGLINAVMGKIDEVCDDKENLIPLYIRKSQAEEGL